MKTYPLKSISVEQAKNLQFKVVDAITHEFNGQEVLSLGDLGVVPGLNKPDTTLKAERALARIFDTEGAVFVRGAGTAAIRWALHSAIKSPETLLIHSAAVYSTTKTTIEMLGLKTLGCNFNDIEQVRFTVREHPEIRAALVQYTRQSLEDSYDMEEVISAIKAGARDAGRDITVITDDNYAVMKVEKTGVQCGADMSCFSCFKLLGPEGIGCVIGRNTYIDRIVRCQYSGGSQTQGHEAMEVLRGLVYAPVALAIQAEVNQVLVNRLLRGEVPCVKDAFLANAQSKVLLVEFEKPIAQAVLQQALKLGAAPNPVGAESKYEVVPMFYRVSGTFRATDPSLADRMIRINPMRSGADTVIRILNLAVRAAMKENRSA